MRALTLRPRHLTRGWCWSASEDGHYGIAGHVDDTEAREIVAAYEGDGEAPEDLELGEVDRAWWRTVPCRDPSCDYDCGGSHMARADAAGRGATPITFVEVLR